MNATRYLRARLKIEMDPATMDFGRAQDGEAGASPQRAVTAEPTKAAGKSHVARRILAPISGFRLALIVTSMTASVLSSGCATSSRVASTSPPAANLAPLPQAVTSFGAASLNGWLYVFGGHAGERHEYSSETVSGAFHRLRLSEGRAWEALPSAPPAQGVAIVAHAGKIYRVGGMAAQNKADERPNLRSQDLTLVYDVDQNAWSPLPPLPAPRSSHDAVVLGETLYVGGGWQLDGRARDGQWHDDLLTLDLKRPDAGWRSIPQPFRRRALAMAAAGDRIYFLGGMDESSTSLDVDIYHTATGAWSKGPNLPDEPMKGFGAAAAACDGRVYCSGMRGDLHQLSDDGASWELIGRLKEPRFFHRIVAAGGEYLVVAGGEAESGKLSSLEVIKTTLSPSQTIPALARKASP